MGSFVTNQCSASLVHTGLLAQLQHILAAQQVEVCHEAAEKQLARHDQAIWTALKAAAIFDLFAALVASCVLSLCALAAAHTEHTGGLAWLLIALRLALWHTGLL